MKRGFTLIELLVVVLIIGILAAVAMPQYQKAVEKARVAEAMVILKKMQDNYRLMSYADGTDDMEMIFDGINLPAAQVMDGVPGRQGKHFCYWVVFAFMATPGACSAYESADYVLAMPDPTGDVDWTRACEGENEKGVAFCKSLGSRQIDDKTWEF